MRKLKKLSKENMKNINGGLRWTACKSTNVDDQTNNIPFWMESAAAYAWNLIYCPQMT